MTLRDYPWRKGGQGSAPVSELEVRALGKGGKDWVGGGGGGGDSSDVLIALTAVVSFLIMCRLSPPSPPSRSRSLLPLIDCIFPHSSPFWAGRRLQGCDEHTPPPHDRYESVRAASLNCCCVSALPCDLFETIYECI